MGASASLWIEVQLSSGVWTDITTDTNAEGGLTLEYGIRGNGPLDCVASSGECAFELRNDAGNSGGVQGYYSPLHASRRSGWTFGIPLQAVFAHGSDTAVSVSSITRATTTATVTTGSAHGYSTGYYVKIAGANQVEYNGTWQITVTGGSTFTFTVVNTATTPATGTITARRARVKHRGKVGAIDPDAGQYAAQRVRVVSYDGMRDLASADIRSVAIQVSQSESTLITAVLDALDSTVQPIARSIDTGVDSYPYAFHDIGPGAKALTVIAKTAINAFGLVSMKGDGTFVFQSRATRATSASAATFANTMHGMTAPSTLEQVFNVVRVTIHPLTIDAAATTVLWSATGTAPSVAAGNTLIIWADYRDPTNTATLIGGLSVVNPLVSGTDYSGNSQSDGLGSDLSASLSVTVEPFASTAKLTITNNHASATIYLVDGAGAAKLQVRGKGVYDRGPQTFETSSTATYGSQPLAIDLDYQSDASLAQSYATYVQAQYKDLSSRVGSLMILANHSSTLLTQALDREPGDVITVTEAVTGLSVVTATIQSVRFDVVEGPWVACTWTLAPSAPFQSWVLGVVTRSELGETTRIGF